MGVSLINLFQQRNYLCNNSEFFVELTFVIIAVVVVVCFSGGRFPENSGEERLKRQND